MGYLVCNECGGYYQLQEGEKPTDFSDECECGGKLYYTEIFNTTEKPLTCPICGSKTHDDASICPKCGENLGFKSGNDDLGHLYEEEKLLHKKRKTIQEYGTGLKAKSKRKELKHAFDLQEILDLRESYLIKTKDKCIKILKHGLEDDNGRFISFEDITAAEIVEGVRQEKSGFGGLIKTVASLVDYGTKNLKINHTDGEIFLAGVKKDDATKLVSFLNQKLNL
ncbi:hypothetical protein [Methanobacterium sp. MZD130B]|uniref:hypothetical protein n=1 Tax=Methanobacterium sp. MZD130B TaxID=3394378 RepID=UPI0039FC533E